VLRTDYPKWTVAKLSTRNWSKPERHRRRPPRRTDCALPASRSAGRSKKANPRHRGTHHCPRPGDSACCTPIKRSATPRKPSTVTSGSTRPDCCPPNPTAHPLHPAKVTDTFTTLAAEAGAATDSPARPAPRRGHPRSRRRHQGGPGQCSATPATPSPTPASCPKSLTSRVYLEQLRVHSCRGSSWRCSRTVHPAHLVRFRRIRHLS
jgi:hypothetical protein